MSMIDTGRSVFQKGQKPGRSKPSGKDPVYLGRVAKLPCAICYHYGLPQLSPTQVHHCIHGRHGFRKVPDRQTIPLCEGHHQGDFDTSKIAVHREPKAWKAAYGEDRDYISWTLDRCTKGGPKPSVRGECGADGCDAIEEHGGFCMTHYRRNAKYGNPVAGQAAPGAPQAWLRENSGHDGDDCLSWPFSDNEGYYTVKIPGGYTKAHRLMCRLRHGEPADAAMFALHSCGNRSCVNPNHLRWGTPAENSEDARQHGTLLIGESCAHSKLSNDAVLEIRERWNSGEPASSIANDFPVTAGTVWAVATGKIWRHVK